MAGFCPAGEGNHGTERSFVAMCRSISTLGELSDDGNRELRAPDQIQTHSEFACHRYFVLLLRGENVEGHYPVC